jgi:Tfp pilus assembly protein PilO
MRLGTVWAAWQRLSARERRLAGVAVGALLLVGIRYGIIGPYLSYTARLEVTIERDLRRVEKMQRQQARNDQVQERVQTLEKRFRVAQQQLVPGETPTLAAGNLQTHIQTLADQSGLQIVTTQVMREDTLGSYRKIAVQLTFRGDTPAIANFLSGVEYGKWLLAVARLDVRSTSRHGVRSPRVRSTPRKRPPLTITLEVDGIMQGIHASNEQ